MPPVRRTKRLIPYVIGHQIFHNSNLGHNSSSSTIACYFSVSRAVILQKQQSFTNTQYHSTQHAMTSIPHSYTGTTFKHIAVSDRNKITDQINYVSIRSKLSSTIHQTWGVSYSHYLKQAHIDRHNFFLFSLHH